MDLLQLIESFDLDAIPVIAKGEENLLGSAVVQAAAAIRPRIHALALALLRGLAAKGGTEGAGAVAEAMNERSLFMATGIGALLLVYGCRFTLHALGLGATDIPVGPAPHGDRGPWWPQHRRDCRNH